MGTKGKTSKPVTSRAKSKAKGMGKAKATGKGRTYSARKK